MRVVVITPPESVVTAQEAVDARVFSTDDDDTFIQTLLDVAQASLDGPTGWLGRAIGFQTLEAQLDELCDNIRLQYPPIVSVTSVKYDDSDGNEQTLSSSLYRVSGNVITRAYGASWPATRLQTEAVRIRYEAGYELADVPTVIKHAIMLMAKELKNHGIDPGQVRSESVDGIGSISYQVPAADDAMKSVAERLLAPMRVFA